MNDYTPPEPWEQEQIFMWAKNNAHIDQRLILLNSSLTGVRLPIGLAVKAKQQGMKKGFPDINMPVVNSKYAGLYIELKNIKGGTKSKEQKAWIKALCSQGYLAVFCNGHKEAINLIVDYLSIK